MGSIIFLGCFSFLNKPNIIIIKLLDNDLYISFPLMEIWNIKTEYFPCGKHFSFFILNKKDYGYVVFYFNERKCKYVLYDDTQIFFVKDVLNNDISYGPIYSKDFLVSKLKEAKNLIVYSSDKCNSLEFIYPKPNNPILKIIKDKTNFPISDFTELGKACYIMRWVNKYFPSGEIVNHPKSFNALFYLMDSKNKKVKTMNCKTYAVVLNDLLNAHGIKARVVHCMPHNRYDIESHYLNEAFIPELNKWIILDSSFGYLIKENFFLNILEVRSNIINGIDMQLYTSLNIRAHDNDQKQKYWYGITKNMYCLELYKNYEPGFLSSSPQYFVGANSNMHIITENTNELYF
ncbi:MAG: transglutaminase-like domain-containing protein [Anaerotignum sp.]|nr:transglutaminase-like domain-containing protein [Anaerotignum sp.]